jgi:hypothetical protein
VNRLCQHRTGIVPWFKGRSRHFRSPRLPIISRPRHILFLGRDGTRLPLRKIRPRSKR